MRRSAPFGGEAYDDRSCRGLDPDLFFPESDAVDEAERAKKVCGGCPVRDACLEYAIVNVIREGIWGGLGERTRRRIRASRSNARQAS